MEDVGPAVGAPTKVHLPRDTQRRFFNAFYEAAPSRSHSHFFPLQFRVYVRCMCLPFHTSWPLPLAIRCRG
jgi:hypothetical protein